MYKLRIAGKNVDILLSVLRIFVLVLFFSDHASPALLFTKTHIVVCAVDFNLFPHLID